MCYWFTVPARPVRVIRTFRVSVPKINSRRSGTKRRSRAFRPNESGRLKPVPDLNLLARVSYLLRGDWQLCVRAGRYCVYRLPLRRICGSLRKGLAERPVLRLAQDDGFFWAARSAFVGIDFLRSYRLREDTDR